MAPQGGARRQAFGACRAYEVLAQYVEHGRACDTRQDRTLHHGQGERGQHQRVQPRPQATAILGAPAGKAPCREPLQLHREQQDEQDGEPEVGQGDADLRQAHQPPVAGALVVRRSVYARAQRQHGRQQHGQHRQRYGELQALQNQLRHRAAVSVAVAQRAGEQAVHPLQVALPGRLVKPQLGRQRCHGLGVGIGAEQRLRGIAGQHFQHPKDHQRGDGQRGDEGGEALQEELGHRTGGTGRRRGQRIAAKPFAGRWRLRGGIMAPL